MKKYLLLLFTLVFAMTSYADKVTEQQALQKAQRFFKDKQIVSKSLTRSMTRGDQSASQEDFYVFNAEKNGGFVIISGDDRTPEVLGYADSGSLDLNNLPPNLKGWLEEYSKQIKALDHSGITQKIKTSKAVTRTTKTPVEPLITTKWGQYSPYNLQCPEIDGKHCVTGCVATAMAQIMNYHKWPQEACAAIPAYTTATRQIQMEALPPTTFKWDKMRDRYWEGEQGESADAVAELIRYCGQAVEMNYDINESGSSESPWHFMKYFGYGKNAKTVSMSQYTITQWEDILYKELSEGRPIIYWGANLVTAHDFICDGYDGNGYYHFNWGWSGDADGFFLLSLLYDIDLFGGYTIGQAAIIGLQPENGDTTIPYVFGYYGEESSTTEFSRNSSSEDFTNVLLTGGIVIQYETEIAQNLFIEYGLGLFKDSQLLSVLDCNSTTLNSTNNTSYKQMSATFGANLDDGVYQIRSIYRFSNSDNWQACYDSYQKYIVATISGNNLLLRKSSNIGSADASYVVNSVNYSYNSKTLIVNLTNTGDSNQELLYIWQKNDERYAFTVLACGFIEPGKTGDVYITLNNKILTSGSVLSISSDREVNNVKWEGTIEFPESTKQNLTCSNVSIANYDKGILWDSKLVITLTITNSGNNVYDDGISYQLQKFTTDGRGFLVMDNKTQPVALDPGETKDIQFVIPNLEANFDYQIFINSINNGLVGTYLAHESFFVVTHSYEYDGMTYSYIPKAKTASVIHGDYQNLESVSIPASITINGESYQVVEIASGAFKGCYFQSITLPEGLLCIGSEAFMQCDIKSIVLPSTIKSIEGQAFYVSSGLKEISIPEGAVSIGYGAFWGCRDLEVLRFPSTLGSIGENVISDCSKLGYVYSAKNNPITVPDDAFLFIDYSGNIPKQVPCPATLIVPHGSVEKYQAATGWNVFTRITDKEVYKLIYQVDGIEYKKVYVVEGDAITPEASPEATDTYQFSGWSEIPETMPNHDVIVTGTFVRHFDVGHVVNVVNYIMSANASAEQVTLYDLNSDSELNIGDIILIVKSILNNGNGGSSLSRTRADNNVDLSQYTATQFVLNVDRGVAIKNIQLVSNMTNSHQMMYSKLDDNTYYVVIYSLSNQLMKPENNNIVKVETDGGGLASITMHDLIVSTINGETECYKGSLSTGIHQVDNEGIPAAIYDLKGQRLDGAKSQKKGLYIINGKKVVVK